MEYSVFLCIFVMNRMSLSIQNNRHRPSLTPPPPRSVSRQDDVVGSSSFTRCKLTKDDFDSLHPFSIIFDQRLSISDLGHGFTPDQSLAYIDAKLSKVFHIVKLKSAGSGHHDDVTGSNLHKYLNSKVLLTVKNEFTVESGSNQFEGYIYPIRSGKYFVFIGKVFKQEQNLKIRRKSILSEDQEKEGVWDDNIEENVKEATVPLKDIEKSINKLKFHATPTIRNKKSGVCLIM